MKWTGSAIVFPPIGMFFLTLALGIRMARMRVRAVARGEVDIGYYRLFDEGIHPASLRLADRHQQNLFEVLAALWQAPCSGGVG